MSDAAQRSRLLAALDEQYLPEPPSTPMSSQEPSPAEMSSLKRRLEAVPELSAAMRFALPSANRTEHRDKRPRYSQAANANPIALLERDGLLGGLMTPPKSRPSPARMRRHASGDSDDAPPVRAPAGSTLYDFALNYDDETPLRPMDIGGADQEQQMKQFIERTLDDMNHGRSLKQSLEALGLADIDDVVPGLNIHLMPHQVIGVSWMLDQELKSNHMGGILGDDMGLGKTVQMIATMAINGPKEDSSARTTLIVVPAALIQQWKDELETKSNGMFEVHIHHGPGKLKNVKEIKERDVIITTYHTLNADCAIPENVEETNEIEWVQRHGGVLARTNWHRVVLDEAQFIRNRKTRSSRAVAMLKATYRWCLTGTPVTNTLADVYGLLRFGRFRPWNDWGDFNERIASIMASDPEIAGLRTRKILDNVMLRRTKTTTAEDGTPLVKLPKKEVEIVHLDFSKEEREIYNGYEKSARIKINKFIRKGTLLKNTTAVLVMILRLRQVSCHPYLLISQGEDAGEPGQIIGSEIDKELSRAKRLMPGKWIKEVRARFLLRAQVEDGDLPEGTDAPDSQCPVCYDVMTTDSGRILECGHEVCFDCILDISKSALQTNVEIRHGEADEKAWEAAAAKGNRPCPTCKKMVGMTQEKMFRSYAFEPEDEELEAAKQARRKANGARKKNGTDKKGDVFMDVDDSDDEIEFVGQLESLDSRRKRAMAIDMDSDDEFPDITSLLASVRTPAKDVKPEKKAQQQEEEEEAGDDDDEDMKRDKQGPKDKDFYNASINSYSKSGTDMVPSAKMVHMIELLKQWDASGDKTIVYSQWTSMLSLVEQLFLRQGIRCLQYTGKMNREAREKTLREFRQPGGPKVILISIKCGGVGLNLVSANRVINLDLSWNFASESQAYDRVHRMGQEKPVTVKRLVIKDTLEERMLRLQDLKTDLSDAALGEGTGKKLHKLSVKEIKQLFGFKNIQDNADQNRT